MLQVDVMPLGCNLDCSLNQNTFVIKKELKTSVTLLNPSIYLAATKPGQTMTLLADATQEKRGRFRVCEMRQAGGFSLRGCVFYRLRASWESGFVTFVVVTRLVLGSGCH